MLPALFAFDHWPSTQMQQLSGFKPVYPRIIASANDTLEQTGRAYYGAHLDNLATTRNHAPYQHIKHLKQIRRSIPALQKAPTTLVIGRLWIVLIIWITT